MTAAMRAVADGLRDLFDTPGLLFLSLLHTTVASVVFGLALGVAGGVTTALEVLEDAESSGLVATRILDPAVTTDLHPRAVDTVSRAFAAHVDGVDPRAFLVTDAIGIEDPGCRGRSSPRLVWPGSSAPLLPSVPPRVCTSLPPRSPPGHRAAPCMWGPHPTAMPAHSPGTRPRRGPTDPSGPWVSRPSSSPARRPWPA